jgi:tetratricopeptide (TPR) repeat protein
VAALYYAYALAEYSELTPPDIDFDALPDRDDHELVRARYLIQDRDYTFAGFNLKRVGERLLQKDPNDVLVLATVVLNDAGKRSGDRAKAVALADRLVKLDPNDHLVYFRYGFANMFMTWRVKRDRRYTTAAIKGYERYLELCPVDSSRDATVKGQIRWLRKWLTD